MFTSNRFRSLVRRFKKFGSGNGVHLPESTKRMIELSDEIAAIHKRIIDRSKYGSPEDAADRERLAMLVEELRTKPGMNEQRA